MPRPEVPTDWFGLGQPLNVRYIGRMSLLDILDGEERLAMEHFMQHVRDMLKEGPPAQRELIELEAEEMNLSPEEFILYTIIRERKFPLSPEQAEKVREMMEMSPQRRDEVAQRELNKRRKSGGFN